MPSLAELRVMRHKMVLTFTLYSLLGINVFLTGTVLAWLVTDAKQLVCAVDPATADPISLLLRATQP